MTGVSIAGMVTPFLVEICPALAAKPPVGIIRPWRISFAAPRDVIHRMIDSACCDFSTPGSKTQPARGEVCAFGAISPVIVEDKGFRHFVSPT